MWSDGTQRSILLASGFTETQPGRGTSEAAIPSCCGSSGESSSTPPMRSNHPRLPLLGLRAILKNDLKLVIDGKRKHVSLRSPLW